MIFAPIGFFLAAALLATPDWEAYFRPVAEQALATVYADRARVTVDWVVQPVARVGPFVCVEAVEDVESGSMLGPNVARGYATFRIDGRQPRRLGLRDFFPEAAIVKALRADTVVQAHMTAGAAPATLADLAEAVTDTDPGVGFPPGWWDRFAFHHVQGDLVAVRIGLPGGNLATRSTITTLGIALPIPGRWRAAFQEAARRGTLMDRLAPQPIHHVVVRRGPAF